MTMASSSRALLVPALVLASFSMLAGGCGGPNSTPLVRSGDTGAPATAPDPDPGPPKDTGEACADANPMKNLYFGELHTHTSYSLDAYATGTRADPSAAYRFARGAP